MEIFYLNNKGQKLYLDREPYYLLDSSDIVDYEWNYSVNENTSRVYGFIRGVRNRKLTIAVVSRSKEDHKEDLNSIVKHFEFDIDSASPGKLYINNYYIPCYVHKSSKDARYINVKRSVVNFEIVKAGGWIKEKIVRFRWQDQTPDVSGRGYPYGYDYDYRASIGYESVLENDVISDMEFTLTIYGYADHPEIDIGGNVYRLNYTIQAGEYVIIDSAKRTIRLVKTNGVVVNLFRYRESNMIFEKIQTGTQQVYWNGSFDFDLLLYEERSEPAWT